MRVHFEYGAEVTEDDNLILWPTDGNRVALIDGDMLPYIVGYTISELTWVRANTRIKHGQFATLEETPECKSACDRINSILNMWVRGAKCDAAKIFMTDSPKNFRINLAFTDEYKGGRASEKPPFFYQMREHLRVVHSAIVSDGDEADDLMSIEQWKSHNAFRKEAGADFVIGSPMHREFSNTVIVSADKDLMIVPGWHLQPGKGAELKWVDEMGWLELRRKADGSIKDLKGAGLKFFYAQMIIGDNVDNYKGIPRKGPKFAFDLLDTCRDEKELFMATLGAYKKHYGDGTVLLKNYRGGYKEGRAVDLMLECGRLAHMAQYPGDIWREAKGRMTWGNDDTWLSS
ncbi:endonuclease [Klebsiella phage vB_KpnP_ZK1]|nr:endonuclease [Klebsiella phage vB_KpnP_ZK1]